MTIISFGGHVCMSRSITQASNFLVKMTRLQTRKSIFVRRSKRYQPMRGSFDSTFNPANGGALDATTYSLTSADSEPPAD